MVNLVTIQPAKQQSLDDLTLNNPSSLIDRRTFSGRSLAATLLIGEGLSVSAYAAPVQRSKDKPPGIILVWMEGGPSNRETFDALPDKTSEDIRGPFKSIRTKIRGEEVLFCELWPTVAKGANYLTLLKGVSNPSGVHDDASKNILKPKGTTLAAELGQISTRPDSIPTAFLRVPGFWPVESHHDRGFEGRFEMGHPIPDMKTTTPKIAPGEEPGEAAPPTYEVELKAPKGNWKPPEMRPVEGLDKRVNLLLSLDKLRDLDSRQIQKMKKLQETAIKLNLEGGGDIAKAILPPKEQQAAYEREVTRYGSGRVAEAFVIAGRLIKAGVGFVTVSLSAYEGFDMHSKLKERMTQIAALADKPLGTLVDDIHKGTVPAVIVVAGEFGRTPKINNTAGRDHWQQASSVLLAGGNFKEGVVFGKTNQLLEVKEGQVEISELPLLLRYGIEGEKSIPPDKLARVRQVLLG